MRKTWKIGLAALATSATLASGVALAATQNFTAEVAFANPLTLNKISDLDFGVVKAGAAAQYTLTTAGNVTSSPTGEVISGSPNAGELQIVGSASQTIDISTGGFAANSGVTPTSPRCSYNGGAEDACDSLTSQAAPGAGKTLLIGVTVAVDGTQADGDLATPTFDVSVVYN